MTTRFASNFAALACAVCVLHATVDGVGAQQPPVVRKPPSTVRDTLRLIPPLNENVFVFEALMQMGQISAELEKIQRILERDMPVEQRVSLMRNMSGTLRGLQQNAEDRLYHIRIACSVSDVPRTARLGIGVWDANPAAHPIVSDVEPRSPAAVAGLEPGDEIRKVDGVDVRGHLLREFVKVPGKKISLTIDRDGAARTLHAVLDSGRASVPEACEVASGSPTLKVLFQRDSTVARFAKIDPMNAHDTLPFRTVVSARGPTQAGAGGIVTINRGGASVAMGSGSMSSYVIFPYLGAYFSSANVARAPDSTGATSGVRVLHVVLNSKADLGGLKVADVVRSVNKKSVRSIDEFKSALTVGDRMKTAPLYLEVIRDEKIVPLGIPR